MTLRPPTWGMWIDDPYRLWRSGDYWDDLVDHGVQTADLMIDTAKISWDPMYTPLQVRDFCELAISHDVAPAALGWPAPRKPIIDAMLKAFERYCDFGVVALGGDTEHLWVEDLVDAYLGSLQSAAEYMLDGDAKSGIKGLYRLREEYDVRIVITTHTGHREATARATLARLVDRLWLQVYSTRKDWLKRIVPWDDEIGSPGRKQEFYLKRILKRIEELAEGTVRFCVGQALYDQQWPGHTIAEALDLALDAALELGVRNFRGWSSKWPFGVKARVSAEFKPQALEVREWMVSRFAASSRHSFA